MIKYLLHARDDAHLNTSKGATMETIKSACTYPISVSDNENAQPNRSIKSSTIAK